MSVPGGLLAAGSPEYGGTDAAELDWAVTGYAAWLSRDQLGPQTSSGPGLPAVQPPAHIAIRSDQWSVCRWVRKILVRYSKGITSTTKIPSMILNRRSCCTGCYPPRDRS